MAPRRRMMGYGSAPLPPQRQSGFPLPPPPDGKPPARLPMGQSQAAPMEETTGESDQNMIELMRLLQVNRG